MDYEHIVFQCRVFFSHGHLSASYPKAKGLKQSNWRNKVKIYPENLQSLSNRIRRDQWLPAPIQCYVSPPAYSKDSTDSEMPLVGQGNLRDRPYRYDSITLFHLGLRFSITPCSCNTNRPNFAYYYNGINDPATRIGAT